MDRNGGEDFVGLMNSIGIPVTRKAVTEDEGSGTIDLERFRFLHIWIPVEPVPGHQFYARIRPAAVVPDTPHGSVVVVVGEITAHNDNRSLAAWIDGPISILDDRRCLRPMIDDLRRDGQYVSDQISCPIVPGETSIRENLESRIYTQGTPPSKFVSRYYWFARCGKTWEQAYWNAELTLRAIFDTYKESIGKPSVFFRERVLDYLRSHGFERIACRSEPNEEHPLLGNPLGRSRFARISSGFDLVWDWMRREEIEIETGPVSIRIFRSDRRTPYQVLAERAAGIYWSFDASRGSTPWYEIGFGLNLLSGLIPVVLGNSISVKAIRPDRLVVPEESWIDETERPIWFREGHTQIQVNGGHVPCPAFNERDRTVMVRALLWAHYLHEKLAESVPVALSPGYSLVRQWLALVSLDAKSILPPKKSLIRR